MFDPNSFNLPITEVFEEVKNHLSTQNTLIVNAPPGAGKSTLLPLALLNEPWLNGKSILILEPRRLAAKTIAMRMSDLLEEEVGKTVGYKIRFENRTSSETKIHVLTEGILTRMIHSDNSLEGVGLVIFDEFHERSIHADVALALCREAQQVLRPDLRILIMSATLNMPELTALLSCPVVVSNGKQYPVEIKYTGQQDEYFMAELAARTIVQATKDHSGDVLAFFPGEREIRQCEELLRSQLRGFQIHPLYGQLPPNKQFAAIMPDKEGRRKVVLATSIAETSLTIEGIKIVVDTGFGRTQKFDPKSGLSRLTTVQISKDSADQRAGRAGRLSAGVCYRMWSKATHDRLDAHRVPEIMEADLASLVLDMAQWGVSDLNQLTWLSTPPRGAVAQATDILHELEALENGKITPHGKSIHNLPCHPRIAHMLVMAKEHNLVELATDLASILEERDPLPREAGIDLNERIVALRNYRKNNGKGGNFAKIEKIAESYRKLFDAETQNTPFDPYETGLLITHAYPERIACARPGNNAQFQLSNGKLAQAGHKDSLAHEPWLAVANLDARDGMGKIFLASPLNPKDLMPLVKKKEVITWDSEEGGLQATLDLRIGSIVLKSTPLPKPDESHLINAICDAIKKEGESLLNFDQEVVQWQSRILSLRKWNPQENWPDVSTPALLHSNKEWLSAYLQGVKTPQQLKKLNLKEILHYSLPHELQSKLDKLAPQQIEVPSGSKIAIEYQKNGSPPILAVRLQEMFGLAETPTVNNGKNSLLLHLLSPGYKPVQITADLNSFWNNTYYEVKKELKGRYPKHVWPENPWEEQAIRGIKKKIG